MSMNFFNVLSTVKEMINKNEIFEKYKKIDAEFEQN